jgi:putative lipase involved disintegration of autophagic bodies
MYGSFPELHVHSGFYFATLEVFPTVLAEIRRLIDIFPSFKIKTTGHSAGAAIAFLTQLELDSLGFPTSTINFG